jgi:hypothetical protein
MAERARRVPAWAAAVPLTALYLLLSPDTADHAAQEYRAWLGLVVWDGGWYGGHHVPGYSILFPPLADLVGARTTGALAAVAAAALFERLAREHASAGAARVATLWFALTLTATLVSGRLTFALGVAIGLGALLAATRGRPVAAAALAAVTALASPIAGAFVALAGAAWWLAAHRAAVSPDRAGRRAAALLVVAGLGPVLVLGVLFPEGGAFPFAASSFWPALAVAVVLALVLPARPGPLRAAALLYAAALVASFVLTTPMGGNAVRLGAIAAGPVAALALWDRRRGLLALLAVPLLLSGVGAAADDWIRSSADPSVRPSFSRPLLAELARRPAAPGRLEVPFTDDHWEARWLAPHIALARGWERQLDLARNGLFYDGRPLTAQAYRRWLDDNAVHWVALPEAPIDYSAAAEAKLVREGLPYLREVWRDRRWRLFAVRDPAPLATGAATATRLDGQGVTLRATRPGVAAVRVRWTPYWALLEGRGCVERSPDDHVRLRLRAAGEVRLGIRFALGRVRARTPRCTG